jgi:hypothetical protein
MVQIKFSEEAKDMFDFLRQEAPISKKERVILDGLKRKLELLQKNVHYGDPIKKTLIPSYYKKKYSANNLFRVELPLYWRMLYTLTDDEKNIEVIAFILDVVDHDSYDSRFGYRKR